MMKCWLAEWLDFLFPVEQDMDGEECTAPCTTSSEEGPLGSAKRSTSPDWRVTLPEIPPMFRAEPLVQEAEKLVRSRR